MGATGDNPEGGPKKTPKIVKIGSNWRSIELNKGEINPPLDGEVDIFQEFSIDSSNWLFETNQNSEITTYDDGVIEVTVLQEGSTPGIKTQIPISLKEGEYVLTVIAHADAESTFFLG